MYSICTYRHVPGMPCLACLGKHQQPGSSAIASLEIDAGPASPGLFAIAGWVTAQVLLQLVW